MTRSGVQVELELALFSNSDSTPTDLMTSKRTTKKLHRCPSVHAPEERKIEIYKEKEGVGEGEGEEETPTLTLTHPHPTAPNLTLTLYRNSLRK